jgi:NAD(P)-dependent dehydrogenase (short-subunit alcohol dehydrogenase family)
MRGLEGKRIVVAGGATGIGAGTAQRLAEEGVKVVVGDINKTNLEKTVAAICAAGGAASGCVFDFSHEASCKSLIQHCVDTYGGIDGLANVGAATSPDIIGRDLDLLQMDDDIWMTAIQVNLLGHIRTIRAALPHFVAQKDGAIVCVSSGAAHIGEPTRPAYATTKQALHAVVRHVASRWGADNVRCNAVSPGAVDSEMANVFVDEAHQEHRRRLVAMLPLGRRGTVGELGASIAFLLSADGAWVTGQVFSINGGQVMRE